LLLFSRYNDVNVLETFIHLLQLISTSEQGVQALGKYRVVFSIMYSYVFKHAHLNGMEMVQVTPLRRTLASSP